MCRVNILQSAFEQGTEWLLEQTSEATLGVWAYETLLCVYLLQKSANHHQAIYLHQLSANWSNISIYPSLKVNYFECVPDCMVLCVSRACLLPGSKQLILPSLFFFLMLLKYTHRPDLQKMKCCLFYSHIIIQANYWFASFFTFILSHNCWVSKLKAFQWTSSALWGVNKKISNSEFHRRERKNEMRSLHSHQ